MNWYLDCYSTEAVSGVGDLLPVNSFFHEDLGTVLVGAAKVLLNERSGIGEIRVARTTKSQSPARIMEE